MCPIASPALGSSRVDWERPRLAPSHSINGPTDSLKAIEFRRENRAELQGERYGTLLAREGLPRRHDREEEGTRRHHCQVKANSNFRCQPVGEVHDECLPLALGLVGGGL